jgi:hypothetical protein
VNDFTVAIVATLPVLALVALMATWPFLGIPRRLGVSEGGDMKDKGVRGSRTRSEQLIDGAVILIVLCLGGNSVLH